MYLVNHQDLSAHLSRERNIDLPFGGLLVILGGNVLQMGQVMRGGLVRGECLNCLNSHSFYHCTQLVNRVAGVNNSRLNLRPNEPDYPWTAQVFGHPQLRVLKVWAFCAWGVFDSRVAMYC